MEGSCRENLLHNKLWLQLCREKEERFLDTFKHRAHLCWIMAEGVNCRCKLLCAKWASKFQNFTTGRLKHVLKDTCGFYSRYTAPSLYDGNIWQRCWFALIWKETLLPCKHTGIFALTWMVQADDLYELLQLRDEISGNGENKFISSYPCLKTDLKYKNTVSANKKTYKWDVVSFYCQLIFYQ